MVNHEKQLQRCSSRNSGPDQPAHLVKLDSERTRDSAWAASDEDAEERRSRWGRPSPGPLGCRWSRWGPCSSARDSPEASRGRPESRGRPSPTDLLPTGSAPATGTEQPKCRWRCWLLLARWGTGSGPGCSGRSTRFAGPRRHRRRPQRSPCPSPDLYSATQDVTV